MCGPSETLGLRMGIGEWDLLDFGAAKLKLLLVLSGRASVFVCVWMFVCVFLLLLLLC